MISGHHALEPWCDQPRQIWPWANWHLASWNCPQDWGTQLHQAVKIPDAHWEEVEKQMTEWLKLIIIQPPQSKFNTPHLLCGFSPWLTSLQGPGNCCFTPGLTPIPGLGPVPVGDQPYGTPAPLGFQWLVETMFHSHQNVIICINNLLLHSSSHQEHLEYLDLLLQWLIQHSIKINFPKCDFGSKEVTYLSFWLTEGRILPGADKLKAICDSCSQHSQSPLVPGILQRLLNSHPKLCPDFFCPYSAYK